MKTCCIIGHRDFKETEELRAIAKDLISDLIKKEKVTKFLFGSKSQFTEFCYDIVSQLKSRHTNLKRVFVRAEYPIIDDHYYNYLKKFYEDSYFYSDKLMTNKFSHIRRNQVMIDKSDIYLFYFNSDYVPQTKTRSGTHIAYIYATKKGKKILNLFLCTKNL